MARVGRTNMQLIIHSVLYFFLSNDEINLALKINKDVTNNANANLYRSN